MARIWNADTGLQWITVMSTQYVCQILVLCTLFYWCPSFHSLYLQWTIKGVLDRTRQIWTECNIVNRSGGEKRSGKGKGLSICIRTVSS